MIDDPGRLDDVDDGLFLFEMRHTPRGPVAMMTEPHAAAAAAHARARLERTERNFEGIIATRRQLGAWDAGMPHAGRFPTRDDLWPAYGLNIDSTITALRMDEPGAGPANTALLYILAQEAISPGRPEDRRPLTLPGGMIHVRALDFSGLPGLTVEGRGSGLTCLVDHTTHNPVLHTTGSPWVDYVSWYESEPGRDSIGIHPQWQPPARGDCLYHWQWNWGGARSDRRRYVVEAVDAHRADLDRPVETGPYDCWKRTAGRAVAGAVPAGTDRATILFPPHADHFMPGSLACLTDGPAVNELYCEYLRVAAVEGDEVIFDRPCRQDYAAGLAVLIPGPFTDNLTLRGLSIGYPNHEAQAFGYLRCCPGLVLDDVTFGRYGSPYPPQGGPLSIASVTGASIRNVTVDGGLAFNCSQDVSVSGLRAWCRPRPDGYAGGLDGEEYCLDLHATDCTLGGLHFGTIPGRRHSFSQVLVRGNRWGVELAPESDAFGLTLADWQPNPWGDVWYCDRPEVHYHSLTCTVPVVVRGKGILINGGRFPAGITFAEGSSGVAVLTGDTRYTVSKKAEKDWSIQGGKRGE